MTKQKAPKWTGNFERYKKVLLIWLRTLEAGRSDSEIVSAVILGLENSNRDDKDQVCDTVFDMDEEQLYPGDPEGIDVNIEGDTREEAIKNYWRDMMKEHPEKKVTVGNTDRVIPGLNAILKALMDKFDLKQEEKLFRDYEEYASLSRDKTTESMNDFIIKYETLSRKLIKHKIVLPDIVLAYNLLKGANLGKEEKLARTSVDTMTFDSMKKTLLKMSDGIMEIGSTETKVTPKIKVKEEIIMYQEDEEQEYYKDEYFEHDTDESYEEEYGINQQHDMFYQRDQQRRVPWRGNTRGYRGRPGSRGSYKNHRGEYRDNHQMSKTQQSQNERRENKYGSQCAICRSIFHWARECPDKDKRPAPILKLDQDMVIDDDNLVYNAFADTKNLGIIDSGAAKTVCGKRWYEIYENSLKEEERDLIHEEISDCSFRFGDGDIVKSNVIKMFPTKICGKDVFIRANIVDNDVPLLISKVTMKNAKASLNFERDQLEMDGIAQELVTLPSNHYAIPIGRNENDLVTEGSSENAFLNEVYYEIDNPKKMALKIHRYFAHASPEKLKKFVSQTKHPKKEELIKEITNLDCNLCKKHQREAPKPKTCLPMAEKFNQTVALDLKFLEEGEIVIHAIDLLTRFSAAMLVKNKTKEEIVEKFFRMWIAIFGRPEQTLCDNGKEFCNSDFVSMCTNLNITMKTTAAFAPWSNGMVERHNALLAEMVEKVKSETRCSTEIALCWAVNAKNSMANVHGFSPQQLVLGYNSYCPGLDDKHISLSQIEDIAASKMVADNLNAMYEARSAFLSAQNSERLKRALKGRVYKAYETKYFIGDKVFYRTKDNTWRGPGIVIGQYKKLVLVKTGGLFVRVYPSRLVLKTDADKMLNSDFPQEDIETLENGDDDEKIVHDRYVRDQGRIQNNGFDNNSTDSESESEDEHTSNNQRLSQVDPADNNQQSQVTSIAREENLPSGSDEQIVAPTCDVSNDNWKNVTKDIKKDRFILKAGDTIRYQLDDKEVWNDAIVLGNAGTVKGVNKNRYNVQSADGKDSSIFVDKLKNLQRKQHEKVISVQDESHVFFERNPDQQTLEKIEKAKIKELENFQHFQVFDKVQSKYLEKDVPVISSRWIIQEKDGGVVKARIVARGFEEGEMDLVDAPTVDKTSLRTILTLATMKNWKCSSLDVKSAFLQSHKLKRDVYLSPPKDIREKGILWKIKKPIYGLKDSAKNWYCTLKSELISLGCAESILDPTVFCYYTGQDLKGLFICHVDDFLYGGCGDSDFKKDVIDKIVKKYDISSSYDVSFTYIGLKIDQMDAGTKIDQRKFADSVEVEKVNNLKSRLTTELLDEKEKKAYQRMLGKVNWLAHQSRPDLSFDAFLYSLCGQKPTVGDLKGLNKLTTKIKTGLDYIWLPKLDENSIEIIAFSDASLANITPDKTCSGEGYLIFLADSSGKSCLLNWKSKKINRVVHSTIAAECLSFVDCMGDAMYIRSLIEEILFKNTRAENIPIKIFVDSSQLKKAIESSHLVTEKLLRLNIAEIKQIVQNPKKRLSVHWISTDEMLSDCLTKSTASSAKLCEALEIGFVNVKYLQKMEEEKRHASDY